MSRSSFISTTSAPNWQDGLAVGTGSLGAVIFGDESRHTVVFSHEEFFLPLESEVTRPADLASILPEVRRLVVCDDIEGAAARVEAAARRSGVARDILPLDPFVPIAGLSISMPGVTPHGYRRIVRFDTGSAQVEWETESGMTRIQLLPDRESAAIAIRVSVDGEQCVDLGIGVSSDRSTDVGKVTVVDFRDRVETESTVSAARLKATVRPAVPPTSGSRPVSATVTIEVLEGQLRVLDQKTVQAVVSPGFDLVLQVGAEVVRNTGLPTVPEAVSRVASDHRSLFESCRLDLLSDVDDSIPIEEVLAGARAGRPHYERAAVEFAFAAGRSAIIASTGVLPPNLVGVWQGSWAPAWSGDYTLNGNVQLGAMAAMYNTGTPELILSLFRLHLRFLDQFETNARRLFGIGGYALPTHLSGHAYANHHSTKYPHVFWYGGGAWALRAAFDYFSATGDDVFVRDVAWPFALKVMEFLTGIVTYIDGIAHFVPSYSPENTPRGRANPLSVDATIDIAQAHDAVRISRAFAAVVGDRSHEQEWAVFDSLLPAYRIDPQSGALAEWASPSTPEEFAHRHASQLYPYWYDDGDIATSAAIDDSARSLVAAKTEWRAAKPYGPPGHQEMAFGLSSIGIAAARLGDSRSAYQCAIWLARDHFESNGISRHDQGSIFNVDACGALPALVGEMLLSSTPDRLSILPALPEEWPSGVVCGLTGRGAVIIDELRWSPTEVQVTLRRRPNSRAAWGGGNVLLAPPWAVLEDASARNAFALPLTDTPRHLRFWRTESITWMEIDGGSRQRLPI